MFGLTPWAYLNKGLKTIILINAAVFALAMMTKGQLVNNFLVFDSRIIFDQPWRIVTYMFSHTDTMHFFFNMLMLWMFGGEVANIMGTRKFVIFYLATGVFAMLSSSFFYPLVLGASGAVYAVMYSYAHYYPERRILVFFVFPMKMKHAIYFFVLMDFMMFNQGRGAVAYMTHIGGMVAAVIWFKFIDSQISSSSTSENSWNVYEPEVDKKSSFNPFDVFKGFNKKNNVIEADFSVIEEEEPFDLNVEDLDLILKKVSVEGYSSLSEKEKDFLLRASETMKTRSGDKNKK
jgi:membrane associated rhomboid family serine protease